MIEHSGTLHLFLQNGGTALQGNGLIPAMESDSSKDIHKGVVTIEYETREGSGKIDKDFKYVTGVLVSRPQALNAWPLRTLH